jgi:uncharacterized protein YigE (DUF2233 family)
MRTASTAIVLLILSFARDAFAVECRTSGEKPAFTTCRVDPRGEFLRLYYAAADGSNFDSFARLQASLAREQKTLVFAMNAGMFHPDMKPVGLLVIEGREIAPVNRGRSWGNFYLQPNGVFLMDAGGARVVSTDEYRHLEPRTATQSGPMLVHRGLIPDIPAFRANSTSRRIRNGVCAPKPDVVFFVISESDVTFREMALFVRDTLGCSEALYLDGTISSLFDRKSGRADARAKLGPIFAVVE